MIKLKEFSIFVKYYLKINKIIKHLLIKLINFLKIYKIIKSNNLINGKIN
jgi:hypothetical protein